MKIQKKDENIIITIPFWQARENPYMEGENVGSHPTLIGMAYNDQWGNEQLGFGKVIDMAYKGKADQETEIMIHEWDRDLEEFKELCYKLGLDFVDLRE